MSWKNRKIRVYDPKTEHATVRLSKREKAMINRLISLGVGKNVSEVLRRALHYLYSHRTRR